MIDAIDRAYFEIIFEEDYSNDYWMKHGSFKGIDFYIRKDGHLDKRLKERYGEKITKSRVLNILQRFIKEELKSEKSFLLNGCLGQSLSFTVHAKLSNVYVSGRFKNNAGVWRCYIATVLPPEDTRHSGNDYFKEIDA